jgi:hypothetical protein
MQTVVETSLFSRQSADVLTVLEKDELIAYLAANPVAGDLIPGTGGIRKLRWSAGGKGTRGGARVIYYAYDNWHPIYALSVYAKGQATDLSAAEKRALTRLTAALKTELTAKRQK